jgi:hypothetical protein
MATLGTPYEDGGKWYQRWYPVEGDIRPEGLELKTHGGSWVPSPSGLTGFTVTEYVAELKEIVE